MSNTHTQKKGKIRTSLIMIFCTDWFNVEVLEQATDMERVKAVEDHIIIWASDKGREGVLKP